MTDDLKDRLRPPGRSVISKCADVDGADLSNVPLTYERIWLQSDGGDGVTWCQHPQDDEDVPYVRADFYAASLARITDLEARLAAAEADRDQGARDYCDLMDRHDAHFSAWQSAKARAEKAEAEVERLKHLLDGDECPDPDKIDALFSRAEAAEAGEDALAEALSDADSYIDRGHYEMARNITRAALAAYKARREG